MRPGIVQGGGGGVMFRAGSSDDFSSSNFIRIGVPKFELSSNF